MQLQKRSKFEEIVNNKPIKIITKPNYTDISNDFHISNIRDFDYDIEKQILDNKKELIQSDLLNEITTRMQRKDDKIKNVLDKTNQETQANLTDYINLNQEGETEDIFSQVNIDNAMKLAEEARKKEAAATMIQKRIRGISTRKKAERQQRALKIVNEQVDEIMEGVNTGIEKKIREKAEAENMEKLKQLKTSRVGYGQHMYGPMIKQKTPQGPYSPTNKGKSQANDESMAEQMEVDAPTEKAEGMNIDTSGVKRVADDTKEEILKRARQGEFIPDFLKILNRATKPMMQQQMIMHGMPFDETHKKSVLKQMIRYSKWSDAVEENTIKKRLEEYKAEHGFLPIENVQETASSSKQGEKRPAESSKNEPKAKAKSQAASSSGDPKPQSQAASSSSEPKAKAKAKPTLPKGEQLKEESSSDPDIEQKQQAPILSPKRARGNITALSQNLQSAFNKGLIIDDKDLALYLTVDDAKNIIKIKDKKEKKRVMDDLLYLYKKYVYDPSLISFNLSPKSSKTSVKKTITKEK